MEGATIGSYVIKRLLGQGGMGAVYLGEHALLKRAAAIKVLLPALSADDELVDRFFNEARATTSIPDPGIVQIFDFGYHTDGSAYIVMEYLEGETLDVKVEGDGYLPAVQALRITRQLATSLEAAHGRGVIHRDLKLENVFMVPDPAVLGGERAKILDFGIAKLQRSEGSRSRTRTGQIMGTPLYMSPEQCKGAHDVDARSDVYALGCMLFYMVTGKPPFDYESGGEIIAAHLREEPPSASSVYPELDPQWAEDLDAIVARCLAKSPDERFQSMAALAGAVTTVLGDGVSDPRTTAPRLGRGQGAVTPAPASQLARPTTLSSAVGATQPPGGSAAIAPAPPRRGWFLPVIGLGVAAAAAIVAVVALSDGQATPQVAAPTPAPAAESPSPEPVAGPVPVVDVDAGVAAEPPGVDEPPPGVDEPPPVVATEPPVAIDKPAERKRPRPSKPIKPSKGNHEPNPTGGASAGGVDRGD